MNIADINAETRALCDTDSDSYQDAILLRRVNAAYEDIVGKILGCDGTWQFDDTNYTTLPIGKVTMVAGQQDYSFDVNHLQIERASVLDENGDWQPLIPLDETTVTEDLAEFHSTNGRPIYYAKKGSSIFLYPAPAAANVTLTSGLKVYFQRTASIFTSAEVTTGTKIPGFASIFHPLICYKAALPYCLTYKKDRVPAYMNEIARLEKELVKFYSRREKDVRHKLTTAKVAFR